jgi:hypothetical protein
MEFLEKSIKENVAEKALSIVDICRREMLSAEIIPLQAKIDVLKEMKEYNKSEYDNKLNELYKQINKLRDEYFKI